MSVEKMVNMQLKQKVNLFDNFFYYDVYSS
jgi:hypothetical protein